MSKEKVRPAKRDHASRHAHANGMMVEKPKNFKNTIKSLFTYLKPHRIKLLIAIIFSIGSTVFMIVGPKILGKATTELANGFMKKLQGNGGINFDKIAEVLIFLVVLYICSAFFSYITEIITSKVSLAVSYDLRKSLAEKMNHLPLKYFDSKTHGEVLSRVTNDIDLISQSLGQGVSQIISSVVTVIGVLFMMFSISWQMTLMILLVIPVSGILVQLVIKKSQKYFKNQQTYLGELNGHVEEMYTGHVIMKAFNGEEKSIETFTEHNNHLYESAWKSQFLSGMMMPIISFVGNLGYVGVCILGGYLAAHGMIEIGDIQAFIQYVRSFNQPIAQLGQILNVLQSTAAASERVFEFLYEEDEKDEGTLTFNPDEIKGNVSFENVHFGYNEDKIIINNFSAFIKAGKKIAIVGPTGAGKTTIVKLLMRFYELNSGSIYIDGMNIKDMKRSDLRSLFGMVLQDAWLFAGSVMDNIRYGKLDASDEEVMHAADMAYVDHFIRTLDHGYQSEINEESTNISQGQKQLLTIARAFLANPKILILDEATSSVDTRTEILIQKGMNKLMENRTSFIIAHRLSTIKDADLILVMKDGDIVEVGNHEDLLKENGFYANLYNSQFESEEN